MSAERALFDVWPSARGRIPWADLGLFPSPLEPLTRMARFLEVGSDTLWVKRDDISAPSYGGNKVRTLEVLFGSALADGAQVIYSTGAFGSNHALAAAIHAPRVGLESGALLFPQPYSSFASANLAALLSLRPRFAALRHWSLLPRAMAKTRREHARRGERVEVMVPGGATPDGALGYVSAALELAQQVADRRMPRPREIVVGVGSTCTSAGLLLGCHLAAELGIGFVDSRGHPAPPKVVAVSVTPWPVTSPIRITRLAVRTSERLAHAVGDARLLRTYRTLRPHLGYEWRYLGRGYGHATQTGLRALNVFRAFAGFELDTTYSAKAAAAFLARAQQARGPMVFWSTKSTLPLPKTTPEDWAWAPRLCRRWLRP